MIKSIPGSNSTSLAVSCCGLDCDCDAKAKLDVEYPASGRCAAETEGVRKKAAGGRFGSAMVEK